MKKNLEKSWKYGCHYGKIFVKHKRLINGETVVVWKDSEMVFVLPLNGSPYDRIGHLFSVLSVYNPKGVLVLLEGWDKKEVVKISYANPFELFLGLVTPESPKEKLPIKEIGSLLKGVYGTVGDFIEKNGIAGG